MILALLMINGLLAEPFKIMTEDWPPYNYQINDQIKGISVAITRAVQQKINNHDPIVLYSWNRAYYSILHKKHHILFSMVRLKEREKNFKWVGPISRSIGSFFEHKDRPTGIKNLEDAKKVKIIEAGAPSNAVYIYLTSLGFGNLAGSYDTDNVASLVHQRVSLAALNPFTVAWDLKRNGYPMNTLKDTQIVFYDKPLFLAFSAETDDIIIHQWQQALDELRASGQFKKIEQSARQEAYKDFEIDIR